MTKKKLSELLFDKRDELNLTQVQYAERLKISSGTLARLERGEQQANAKTLSLLRKYSGISPDLINEGWDNEYGGN
jgi:transcriptional regulator with XRE-family HTH domain